MNVDNDLKFFTNEPERDLYSRFCNILKGHTQYFDILVGYFRTSGFFKLYAGRGEDSYTCRSECRCQYSTHH